MIRSLARGFSNSLLCGGDFNDLAFQLEKRGGAPHPNWCLEGFRQTLSECMLQDLGLVGHQFTWERGKGSNSLVEEWLDRVTANGGWRTLFSQARVVNVESFCSDYSILVLETRPRVHYSGLRRFKFENV